MTFFNTTALEGQALRDAVAACERQEDAVLAIYQAPGVALSPSEVHRIGLGVGRRWLLTSVRRAITNLSTGSGALLSRTDEKKLGPYGAAERVWIRIA